MSKEAVFTLKIETELRDNFMAAARKAHRPASQIARDLMREFVEKQNYDEYVALKVAEGRAQALAGQVVSNEDVEAAAQAHLSELTCRTDETKA